MKILLILTVLAVVEVLILQFMVYKKLIPVQQDEPEARPQPAIRPWSR